MRIALQLAIAVAAVSSGGCDSTDSRYDPCAGRACGDACTVCAPGAPDCFETAVVKACSAEGGCVAAPVVCGATAAACTYGGQTYPVGASFPAGDGCNECSCVEAGKVACTAKGCR